MHDIRAIRADPVGFGAALTRRGLDGEAEAQGLVAADADRRAIATALQTVQAARNALARQVGQGRRAGLDTAALEAEATEYRARAERDEQRAEQLAVRLHDHVSRLPNVLDADVPDGADETHNVELRRCGAAREVSFAPRQHFELGEALGLMDFDRAARLSGSRFTVLRGGLARLERGLGQFMLDLHTGAHGYEEASVPALVNDAALFGTGQLPKFAEDLFRTTDGRWLIPTSEVPLTNLAASEILPEACLPIRRTALTDCFRSEAGASGRDTRGMLRQHQFRKVELVSITRPEDSDAEHERMTACAEAVLEALELPYRRMFLCSGDTGFSAARTYDLEVWLPGQGMWREISSCSNTRAFQARRMNARFRPKQGDIAHVHTLNGSGVAVGRALIAVMENYQRADGGIDVPAVLQPAMAGLKTIGRGSTLPEH